MIRLRLMHGFLSVRERLHCRVVVSYAANGVGLRGRPRRCEAGPSRWCLAGFQVYAGDLQRLRFCLVVLHCAEQPWWLSTVPE